MAFGRRKPIAHVTRRRPAVWQVVVRVFKIVLKVVAALVLVAALAAPAVIMNDMFGYMAILVAVIAMILSVVCLLVMARKVSVVTAMEDVSCVRGHGTDLGLALRNDSFLVCSRATADIYVSDLFGGRNDAQATVFMMPAKASVDFNFGVDMTHVGIYEMGIDRVRLYDFTGLAHRTLPLSGRFTATVLPRIHPVEELRFSDDDAVPTNNHTRSAVLGGFDYTGVREYEMGDPMKQIHWKLSAHTREYMTKLRESNQQQEYAVLLDFASLPFGTNELLMEVNDALIETALSLMSEVANHDLAHKLLFCGKDGTLRRTAMPRSEELADLVGDFRVIEPNPGEGFPDAAFMVEQESQEHNRATNVLVVTSRPTTALAQQLERVKVQGRTPELYVVVPAACTSRDIENALAPVRGLDEFDVAYFVVTTDPGNAAPQGGDGR